LQLLSSDFESLEFGALTTFSMATPPPTSLIKMPFVSAGRPNLEILFKESWVVEPYYALTVKRAFAGPVILLDILQPIDHQKRVSLAFVNLSKV
jgi:hypothetical protein